MMIVKGNPEEKSLSGKNIQKVRKGDSHSAGKRFAIKPQKSASKGG